MEILQNIVPIFLAFFLGYFLKNFGFLKKERADIFFKLVFSFFLPVLIILSVSEVDISPEMITLPFIPPIISLFVFFVSFFSGKFLKMENQFFGPFLVGTIAINIGFTLPFIINSYGNEGLARIIIFDMGNAFMVFTLAYYLACRYGENGDKKINILKKLFSSPPLWALGVGLVINFSGTEIPRNVAIALGALGNFTVPLILIAVGTYFTPKIVQPTYVLLAVFIRMFLGLLMGFVVVSFLGLEGIDKYVVLMGSSAPIGFSAIIFSSLEKMNKEFAASMVSVGMLVGIFLSSFLTFFLS